MPKKLPNMASTNDRVSSQETIAIIPFSFYLTFCISPNIFLVWKWSLANIYNVDPILIFWLLFPFKYRILPFWSWSVILIFLKWFHCLDIIILLYFIHFISSTLWGLFFFLTGYADNYDQSFYLYTPNFIPFAVRASQGEFRVYQLTFSFFLFLRNIFITRVFFGGGCCFIKKLKYF